MRTFMDSSPLPNPVLAHTPYILSRPRSCCPDVGGVRELRFRRFRSIRVRRDFQLEQRRVG